MSEAKPFASLGPTLLARKGGARPAMRSQIANINAPELAPPADSLHEDLGWNDMGEDHTAEFLPLTPANEDGGYESDSIVPRHEPEIEQAANATNAAPAMPAVPAAIAPVASVARIGPRSPAKPKERRSALESGRRAAFTLRVDADRHLRLRLACTIRNRSAQELVTEALDKLLAEMPDLDTLASQVKRN